MIDSFKQEVVESVRISKKKIFSNCRTQFYTGN